MDALARRDALFSRLHASYLKPLGYKKAGAWSRVSAPPLHWGVYLRSSRWNTRDHVTFWVDICVLRKIVDPTHRIRARHGEYRTRAPSQSVSPPMDNRQIDER